MGSIRRVNLSGAVVAVLFFVLTASLVLNVLLATRAQRPRTSRIAGVTVGGRLSSITARDHRGLTKSLRLDDGASSIVYIMSPSCVWCARNLDNIRKLYSATASQYRFVGFSNTMDGLDKYAESGALPFPLYTVDSKSLRAPLDLSVTPQTVVVLGDGKVEKVWVGALAGDRKDAVERFFGVSLPGLVGTPKQ